jgi:U3 small nucleolar RNA-associated protein 12
MGDEVTCVKFSKGRDPKKQLLCVATLDATVRVYFKDSLKFFLQLYGHKLPVTCMDVADDSSMLATGSHDKTIKLWGLDFGDCHRSLLAHGDSVTALEFVPRTHCLFSASKDRTLKWAVSASFEAPPLPGRHSLSLSYTRARRVFKHDCPPCLFPSYCLESKIKP